MTMTGIVESLCDLTGNMVRPWAEAGCECHCYDLQESTVPVEQFPSGGVVIHHRFDVMALRPGTTSRKRLMGFAFPSCTDLAVSGALHFKSKGLRALIDALELVEACRVYLESLDCPWMLENPISTLSTYWREPDYIFDPHWYCDRTGGENDTYTKSTCLWTGGGFVMPDRTAIVEAPLFGISVEIDDRIHKMPPSENRANLRSATPRGFARAVFEANYREARGIA